METVLVSQMNDQIVGRTSALQDTDHLLLNVLFVLGDSFEPSLPETLNLPDRAHFLRWLRLVVFLMETMTVQSTMSSVPINWS